VDAEPVPEENASPAGAQVCRIGVARDTFLRIRCT